MSGFLFHQCFRAIQKNIIEATHISLLKPESKHVQQLIGVGITGVHASLSLNIAIDIDVQAQLARHIVKLSRQCNANKLNNFFDLTHGLDPIKLNLRGRAGCDDQIKPHNGLRNLQQSCDRYIRDINPDTSFSSCSLYTTMHIMTCPSCSMQQPAQQSKLRPHDLSIKIECSGCNVKHISKHWKCNCMVTMSEVLCNAIR